MPRYASTGSGRKSKSPLPPQAPAQASDDASEFEGDKQEITEAMSVDEEFDGGSAPSADDAPAEAPAGRSFISSLAADHLDARRGRGRLKKTQNVSGAYGTPDAVGKLLDPNSDFVTFENGDEEEPEEPAPVMAEGRGHSENSDAVSSSSSTAQSTTKAATTGAPSQPRGRGRLRKSDAAAGPAKSSSARSKPAPAAVTGNTGRGRPRKSDAVDRGEGSDAAPAEAVKRGRGGPRKSDFVKETEEEDEQLTEAVKRGRGRSPKSDAAEEPDDSHEQPVEPVKSGRGRPSKSSTTPDKAAPSTIPNPKGRPLKAGGAKKSVPTGRGSGSPRKSDGTSSDSPLSDAGSDYTTQDESAILNLPPELLTRVFAYLGAGARTDVSACRLVCHSFHELSSPFLITTVVFAKRLDAIRRLNEVLDHRYFSKHVTHMVWDASKYETRVAEDWNEYVERCGKSPRSFSDADWTTARTRDAEMFRVFENIGRPTVGAYGTDHANGDTTNAFHNAPEADAESAGAVDDDQASSTGVTSASLSQDDSESSSDSEGDSATMFEDEDSNSDDDSDSDSDDNPWAGEVDNILDEEEMLNYQNRVYSLGCHRGLPDYYRLWDNYRRIKATMMHVTILAEAIKKLPKLRHFSFTDYRGLARPGESYDTLCRRLFGNTLEPTPISITTPWSELSDIFNMFTGFKRRLDSFAIGEHPFDASSQYIAPSCQLSAGEGMMRWLTRQRHLPRSHVAAVLRGVRFLRLPMSVDCMVLDEESDTYVSNVKPLVDTLNETAPSLLELQLVISGALSSDTRTPITKALSATNRDGAIVEVDNERVTTQHFFTTVVSGLRFERLQTIEIRGWEFNLPDLHSFLIAPASTLREIHIIDCLCNDSYAAFATAADQWSSTLHLTGIEVFALRFSHADKSGDLQWIRKHEYGDKALRLAKLDGRGMRSPWTPQVALQEEPTGRPELEAMVMGGRSNGIVRRTKSLAAMMGGRKWWEVPVEL